ncbi:uncharacterized protein DNG_02660 [Cephalotrichum gorgonifer]|uniref:Geranylgeranyl pyrophosphate synthetase n=1 Tax=Cephalotrichum gorgonifer TaxID=2041049 RepID=A0AAE8MTY6_9PEZI|nr:uncharacterized protein DNG_02660 [Cephalotrichum gorgonifer]
MAHHWPKSSYGGSWEKRSQVASTPAPPLGPLLSTIEQKDLLAESAKYTESARITDCEYVASFNWRNSRRPSIFVPGNPPRWTPMSGTQRFPRDSGSFPLDRNGYHSPKHPFEATALSILHAKPEPPEIDFDFVCASASLGYLISFCLGGNEFRPFRALVEVVGGAVHLFRRDNSPAELIPDVQGYGHTFPDAYTSWDSGTAGSTSHQRVIRYALGGLNILLRGEIDGYLPWSAPARAPKAKVASVDELVAGLDMSNLSPRTTTDTETSAIAVRTAGSAPVPQSSLFDLKTRSVSRKGDDILTQQLPRLWRSQIPNFILAFHERGVFDDITVRNVRDRIVAWERENAETIAVLIALLRRLADIVSTSEGGKVELTATVEGRIEVREQLPDAGEVLSSNVRARWGAWLEQARGVPEKGGSSVAVTPATDSTDSDVEADAFSERIRVHNSAWDSEPESEKDYTACGASSCGYCGECGY